MKLIILSSKLKEGLSFLERSIQESGNLPILKNIYIKASDGKIIISGTNLEFAATVHIAGKVNEEGVVTAPFSAIYKIISNSDSERISLESDNQGLKVKTDNYEALIQTANPDDFPIIPKIKNNEKTLTISAPIIKSALLKVLPATGISEIRPEISGILMDYQITLIKVVGTDTFRLGEKVIPESQFQGTFNEGFKVIIPLKVAQEVVRSFSDAAEINIQVDDHQILFKNNDLELISRLIDGEYPDYQTIIPKSIKSEIIINRGQFINAVKLVSSFAGRVNEIKIRLLENKKTIEVYSASQNVGENRYLVPVKFNGEDFDGVSFNWRYLHDGLRSLESEDVSFGLSGDNRPAVLKSPADQSFFYILMPIKP